MANRAMMTTEDARKHRSMVRRGISDMREVAQGMLQASLSGIAGALRGIASAIGADSSDCEDDDGWKEETICGRKCKTKQLRYPIWRTVDVLAAGTDPVNIEPNNDFMPMQFVTDVTPRTVEVTRVQVGDVGYVGSAVPAEDYLYTSRNGGLPMGRAEPGRPVEVSVRSIIGVDVPAVRIGVKGKKVKWL